MILKVCNVSPQLTVRNTGVDSLPLVSVDLNLASTLTLQVRQGNVSFLGAML